MQDSLFLLFLHSVSLTLLWPSHHNFIIPNSVKFTGAEKRLYFSAAAVAVQCRPGGNSKVQSPHGALHQQSAPGCPGVNTSTIPGPQHTATTIQQQQQQHRVHHRHGARVHEEEEEVGVGDALCIFAKVNTNEQMCICIC